VFSNIYLIDVNLDYYQNNSRLFIDVGKLPNQVKSVSLSLDLSLFDFIYCSPLLCAVTTDPFTQIIKYRNFKIHNSSFLSSQFSLSTQMNLSHN
jgi:hypothetical protein